MQSFLVEFRAQIPEAMMILVYAHLMLLVTWPIFLLIEKRTPAGEPTPRSNFLLNWKIVFSNLFLTPLFYALAVTLSVLTARSLGLPALAYPTLNMSLGIPVLDGAIQVFVLFVVAAFLGDFWYYWWHRMQHELPFLWELHKLHHSDENLNATTIFRSHFFELAGQALVRGMTVGLVFDLAGVPQNLMAILVASLAPPIWDIFIHSNVRMDGLRYLLPFLSTPQFHWIHHSRLPEHQDKNYAIWLPLFDVIFGSYFRPRVDEYPPTGLSSGEKIETLWDAQLGPFAAWIRMLRGREPQREPHE